MRLARRSDRTTGRRDAQRGSARTGFGLDGPRGVRRQSARLVVRAQHPATVHICEGSAEQRDCLEYAVVEGIPEGVWGGGISTRVR